MESQASRMVTWADNRKPHIKSKITLIFFIVLVGLSPLKLYLKFVFIIVCGRAIALEIHPLLQATLLVSNCENDVSQLVRRTHQHHQLSSKFSLAYHF